MRKLFAALLFALSLSAADLHLIVAADTHAFNIGGASAYNRDRMLVTLEKAALGSDMGYFPQVLDGKALSPQSVGETLDSLQVEEDDTLVFYYSGHGFRLTDKGSKWPYFDLTYGEYAIDMDQVIDTLRAKKPRLLLIFADCCNVAMPLQFAPLPKAAPLIKSAWGALFRDAEGEVIAAAAQPSQYSIMLKQTVGEFSKGGIFTNALLEAIKTSPSWGAVEKQTIRQVEEKITTLLQTLQIPDPLMHQQALFFTAMSGQ